MVKTIDISGFPHAYDLSSLTKSSTVLVFIHGWLLSRAYWQPVIQQLDSEYQCLSYDLRGFGESQRRGHPLPMGTTDALGTTDILDATDTSVKQRPVREEASVRGVRSSSMATLSLEPQNLEAQNLEAQDLVSAGLSQGYTPAAYAQDLKLLLQQLNITQVWLVGHSLGGSIALWTAHQFPELVKGVICVNAGGGIYLKEEFERFRSAGQQLIKFRPRWLSYIPFLDLALTRMNVARPIALRWGRQRLLDLLHAQSEAAIGALLDSTTEAEVNRLPEVVSRIKQPVHFIAGANDTVMEPQYVQHLASFHPSFECCGNNVSEIPECGHMAMVERPEAVAEEIRSIINKESKA
ncbi:MAG TPA: alpha/beta hydrolase [Allocoleopsis sp.]